MAGSTPEQPPDLDETGILTASFTEMVTGLREREKAKDALSAYMSPEVTAYLLKSNGGVELGGDTRQATVLIANFRNYSTIAEEMPDPSQVADFLNDYLTYLLPPLLNYRGTLESLQRGNVSAVFGVPVPRTDHSLWAAVTALEMQAGLQIFNTQRLAQNKEPVDTRIVVNTGEVFAGNVGIPKLMRFGTWGRMLEESWDISERTRCPILIGHYAYEPNKDLLEVKSHHFKEKQRGIIDFYELTGLKPGVDLASLITHPTN